MLIDSYQAQLSSLAVHQVKEQGAQVRIAQEQVPDSPEPETDTVASDSPDVVMKQKLIEALRGRELDWYAPHPGQSDTVTPGPDNGWQVVEWFRKEEYQAYLFVADINIQDKNGNILQLSTSVAWQHLRIETHFAVSPRDLRDPLVLQFDHGPVAFEGTSALDLDGDGEPDFLPVPKGNAGYLVSDKNENGLFDRPDELVGLKSGNAWQDLRALDDNQNGWLDRQDAGYNSLYWWQPNRPDRLNSLAEKQVDGILLQASSTPATLYQSDEPVARLAETGVFLHRGNQLGLAQRFDFYV